MHVYRTNAGVVVQLEPAGPLRLVEGFDWDQLFTTPDGAGQLAELARSSGASVAGLPDLLPPIKSQEVWAAGVTYRRSMTARMEESATAGGSDFYDLVYHADRPELFFKATAQRVVGPGGRMRLRADAQWTVPEAELTLAFAADGRLIGYTIGDDLSCRDIEAANPLYLPQAKIFDRCAAIGPALYLSDDWPDLTTRIALEIERAGEVVFAGETRLDQMKQRLDNLQQYLFRDNAFPAGCFLMTGTGIVPPDDFTLAPGDRVSIEMAPVGTLTHTVE